MVKRVPAINIKFNRLKPGEDNGNETKKRALRIHILEKL